MTSESYPLAVTIERKTLSQRLLLAFDAPPWCQLWRIGLGYAIVPAWLRLTPPGAPRWTVFPFFVGALLAVRIVPAVIRRLIPFDGAVQATWRERRRLAKRFDSYQWQKLFWIALGLTIHMSLSANPFAVVATLTVICAVAGASGLVFWTFRRGRA